MTISYKIWSTKMLKIAKKSIKKHTKLIQQFPPTVKQVRLNINV